jgi:hypothetical protein
MGLLPSAALMHTLDKVDCKLNLSRLLAVPLRDDADIGRTVGNSTLSGVGWRSCYHSLPPVAFMSFEKLAQYVGLGAPFVAASLIYGLFYFFDKKSSPAANKAIKAWIKGEGYKQLDLKAAVVEGFDNLYGTPLLSVRSFFRSAGVSILAVMTYMFYITISEPMVSGGSGASHFLSVAARSRRAFSRHGSSFR